MLPILMLCLTAIAPLIRAAEPVIIDLNFPATSGKMLKAYLVKPGSQAVSAPAILFVHWLEPQSPDSNRSQYLGQAMDLPGDGVVSLLPETMWSDPEWFTKRDPAHDYDQSMEQATDLGRALDFLLSQPGIDKTRVAYDGHDFGMMFGLLLSRIDKRPRAWALQAGISGFEDWYLYGCRALPKHQKQKVRD